MPILLTPVGTRIVDFCKCNLHAMNYSIQVHATMQFS